MRIHNPRWRVGVVLALVLLLLTVACGPAEPTAAPTDAVVAVYTQAAATAFAALTQTAVYFTPTPEPTATFTPQPPTPTINPALTLVPTGTSTSFALPPLGGTQPATLSGPICDDLAFVADTTIPDYTVMTPGQAFTKIWRVRNTGVCTWDDGYVLVFAYGDQMSGQAWGIYLTKDFLEPGYAMDIAIPMVAPTEPGTYYGHWRMMNDRGMLFGMELLVIIVVKAP